MCSSDLLVQGDGPSTYTLVPFGALAPDTSYQIVYAQRIGTGTAASFWIVEVPDARLLMEPKPVKVGERLYFDLAFHGLQDPTVALDGETGTDLDFVLATSRIAFG